MRHRHIFIVFVVRTYKRITTVDGQSSATLCQKHFWLIVFTWQHAFLGSFPSYVVFRREACANLRFPSTPFRHREQNDDACFVVLSLKIMPQTLKK